MTSIYPKLPGYSVNHDPTKIDFKKVSSHLLQKIQNNEIKPKQNVYIPRGLELDKIKLREANSFSSSQQTFQNPFGGQIGEQFTPDWVKLDKRVLRFYGYFKESVVEIKNENSRVRKVILYYYLVDDTISITEEKEQNSGIVQGPFLSRGKIKKDEFNFFAQEDLIVGRDIYIYGKYIKIYDCDQYTREYYEGVGLGQGMSIQIPLDSFHNLSKNKIAPKRDNLMKDYLEHKLGGGRVVPQKQFLENDRKVLKFNAKFDSLKYIVHYFLADDTVEIREVHGANR